MNDRDVDLSCRLDGESAPHQDEAVSRRILDDADARARYAALRDVSALLRERFRRDAEAVAAATPALPAALSADALRKIDVAARTRRLLLRAAALVVVAAAIAGGVFLSLREEVDAPTRKLAVAARTVAEAAYVEVTAEIPALNLVAKGVEFRGLFGPDGRFVVAASLPKQLGKGGPAGLLGALGGGGLMRFHAGFDGETAWRYRDGDAKVFASRVDAKERAEIAKGADGVLGGDLLLGGGGPSLGFDAWRKVIEHAAAGGAETKALGARDFDGESLDFYEVKLPASHVTKLRSAKIGVDARGDVRVVETNMVRVRLNRAHEAPDATLFSYRSYAPEDVAIDDRSFSELLADRAGPESRKRGD